MSATTTRIVTTYYFDTQSKSFRTKSTEKAIGPNDVSIRTTHSGICYTDVHAVDKGCGLGHEGVGFVEAVGECVTNLEVGDRVGWGWLHSSCDHCATCATGHRQYCAQARGFAFSDLDQGAFGDRRIIHAAFAYKIPENVSSVDAGPFMCAGASVYEALHAADTKPSDTVGVCGVGGLGHMAVLFARAMGCHVTAISGNKDKAEEVLSGLGATEFRSHAEIETAITIGHGAKGLQSKGHPQPMNINVLLITSNEVPDLNKLLPLLARRATIVLMTIQPDAILVPYMPFVLPGHRLIASTEASRENHIKMLEFVAKHQIKPWTEQFPMDSEGLKQAFDQLKNGRMRYRGVLVRLGWLFSLLELVVFFGGESVLVTYISYYSQ